MSISHCISCSHESCEQLTTWRAPEYLISTRDGESSLQEPFNRFEIPRDGYLSSYGEHNAPDLEEG